MLYLCIILGCIFGILVGVNMPVVSYTYSSYVAIAIVAAMDTVLGGISSYIQKKFDIKIFITGFFGNAILSILLTYLGNKLNVDIYLAAVFVFVGRMFTNLAIIRRYYVEKISEKVDALKLKKQK
jgi:small basic protein